MRNDFAVFILTHGRADNVVTVPAIKKAGYTGKIYFIIDDEDEQAEEYKKNFGADRVIIFDKQAAYDRADTPIEYRGTMNEDVVTYTTLSSRGHLFFSNTQYCVVQLPTQSLSGGMTDAYKEGGTYLKTFYAIMSMPSAVKVSMMYTTHKRIHHRINWEHTAPKILNEKWRKERKEDT